MGISQDANEQVATGRGDVVNKLTGVNNMKTSDWMWAAGYLLCIVVVVLDIFVWRP